MACCGSRATPPTPAVPRMVDSKTRFVSFLPKTATVKDVVKKLKK